MDNSPAAESKIFVLDTSVILFDHRSFLNFGEHDVAIPITVLEELDNFKKGNDSINYEARQFIRMLDDLSEGHTIRDWIPLPGEKRGRLKVILNGKGEIDAEVVFESHKMDHKILNAALTIKSEEKEKTVVMVTKDVNLRLKAKALSLKAEDYRTGKVTDVADLDKSTKTIDGVDKECIERLYDIGFSDVPEAIQERMSLNGYYILKNSEQSVMAFYSAAMQRLERVEKYTAYGVKPRNAEQAFALHAILNPDIKLVTIGGVPGSGKTLLALAGALAQRRDFKQIYLARPIVPLSNKDVGYLPGDIKSKLNPYMEPLWDNLKFIKHQFNEHDKEYVQLSKMVEDEKLLVTPLAYIRGRSLSNIIFIVDEAQNLTPHEIKTIITRAGENTKIIFTGDIHQIDTPYLDTQSNGLSTLMSKIKSHELFAQISLEKGERSELANLASTML
ncbi:MULTISPECIES: PhoH family protein [Persicobacter]|uniref:Phosphate starvation protein PhoH n=1 Tax=Persicobacter diffluens TaxID=981 RepID=A0AAN4VXU2_9BACT|nr:PhoH family protein [Persicobacter sp. CCB-QB2]GJM62024.1 phosphate starvation protein PhoH [Persicobacter diffluens]